MTVRRSVGRYVCNAFVKNARKPHQPISINAIQCVWPFYAFLMAIGRIVGLLGLVLFSLFSSLFSLLDSFSLFYTSRFPLSSFLYPSLFSTLFLFSIPFSSSFSPPPSLCFLWRLRVNLSRGHNADILSSAETVVKYRGKLPNSHSVISMLFLFGLFSILL